MKNKGTKGTKKKRQNPPKGSVNYQHKDRLFRFLFRDRKHLLELYNALNNTDYQNERDLTITTLEGAIYMGMKNDLSFIVDSVMSLYEHQSTWNPNMPLRGLIYFAKLYQVYVKRQGYDLSGNSPISLPFPQYIIFYNGNRDQPDHSELLLSDAFESGNREQAAYPCLECRARMLNINQGHNQELLEKCRRLWEYAELIRRIRDNQDKGLDIRQAVDGAVDSCIQEGILADILIRSKMEVVDMLLEEYDEKATRRYLRKEAFEEGREAGRIFTHVSQIRQKMKKGRTEEEIAEALEEPVSYVRVLQKWMEQYPEESEAREHMEELRKELKKTSGM